MHDKDARRVKDLSWKKKLCFGLLTTALTWVAIESILAIAGVQPSTQTADPLLGFSRQVPLLESYRDTAGTLRMRTAPGKLVWFNDQSFAAKKPTGTRRIFCVGGSTTYGRPFSDATSYSGWLREWLPMTDPDTRWEVINAGGVSYASYRVAEVMEELSDYEPDLFLVYSVHNEFLERRTYEGLFESSAASRDALAVLQSTRTGSLLHRLISGRQDSAQNHFDLAEEVDERLNHTVGPSDYVRDDTWQSKVVRHYQWNLQRMVDIAKRSGAEIAFLSPAANLKDCGPFKSVSDSDEESLALDLNRSDWPAVVTDCQQILASDPRNANAHFQLGQALLRQDQMEDAESAFRRAVDEDICPLRATSAINDAVRKVATEFDVTLVDFEQRLAEHCQSVYGHHCFGRELFLDHVHPTIDVHGLMAWWIIEQLQQDRIIAGKTLTVAQRKTVSERIQRRVDLHTRGVAFRNLGKVMHWAGKFREAYQHASDALELIPQDLESMYLRADCQRCLGNRKSALLLYDELFKTGDFPRAHINYAELLFEAGRFDEAKSYLLPVILEGDAQQRDCAMYLLGTVHLTVGEYDLALECFNGLDPSYQDDSDVKALKSEANAGLGASQPD